MPQIHITLEARSPLLLGESPGVSNVQTSLAYVSGSVWRGALANAVLGTLGLGGTSATLATEEPAFAQLFAAASPARFGFLYPARKPWAELTAATTLPLPLSVRMCKSDPGFREEPARGAHGVYDCTLSRLREAARGEAPHQRGDTLCPHCGIQRLERSRGSALRIPAADEARARYQTVQTGTRSFVRVGLSRFSETAQDQILYVLEALVSGSGGAHDELPLTFVGHWNGDATQVAALHGLLQRYLIPDEAGGYRLRIGGARARGMGQVVLRLAAAPDPAAAIAERLMALQPMDAGQRLDPAHLYATLTLRSPLALLDPQGLPVTTAERITPEVLRAYQLHVPNQCVVLAGYSIVEQEAWCGWSSAWGLPKPTQHAIAAGSVLVVRAPTQEQTALVDWLTTVARSGLGERQAEGWGEVLVCDQFHRDHDQEA